MKELQSLNDTNLVLAFQNGNLKALDVLIERYKDKLYSSIYFLVKDEWIADDIYQDTFIRIIDTLRFHRYNEQGKFLPWAARIAHNLCIDFFRKQKRKPPIVTSDQGEVRDIFDAIDSQVDNAEQKMMQQQSFGLMYQMLDLLPNDQREVIVLRHFADLSFKEIAVMTNCSINTALGRMRYGLINLRKIMTENSVVL
ncbi:RNA polymerase sigma factor [Rhizosphaericola mali]|uniref:Sigma-70 family RNA polymerase sigma factor n=1 Tax=Rhizosphaericola mali TaxID=2545455 RepID=A0A5P2GAB8_9BACT|nr:sigma-70 family RNA polymerase sigma factor [Rhizosphaericola mali]QES90650.1 sigma-70 family RNA polymerase sigma factor [Rhizosphaericola mali]